MTIGLRKTMMLSITLLIAASVVSSCGRRGSLERPPSATVVGVDETGNATKKNETVEDKPFILDALL